MRRKSFFVRNYSACWNFLKESRWYIVFTLGLFALTFIIGFAYPYFFREEIFSFIRGLMTMFDGKTVTQTIFMIFFNNLKVSFMAIVLGVAIGIFPLFTSILNGYLLGFVSREAVNVGGIGVLWQLFPHGIFELPAVILSIGIGLKIGANVFRSEAGKRLKHNFIEGLRFFIFVLFPLLLVAGIIEGLLIGFLN
jgi:stage II sporulation protein M